MEIPLDEEAERICAGLAAVGRNCAADLLSRFDAADCYDPRHRRIVEHALDPDVLRAEDEAEPPGRLEARLVTLAKAAGVDVQYIRDRATLDAAYGRCLVAPRSVTLAARRRDLMRSSCDIYNGAGTLPLDKLLALAEKIAALRDEIIAVERRRSAKLRSVA